MSNLFDNRKIIHIPVMRSEMLHYLKPKDEEKYLDCTFGAGGYSDAILASANCSVTALDRDKTSEQYAAMLKDKYDSRFEFYNANFADIRKVARLRKYNGAIFDLGISSVQLDNKDRGLSFLYDGELDMRMSREGESAKEFLAKVSESELADVIYHYGDEKHARKIAREIVKEREENPIITTLQLSNIVKKVVYRVGKIHPATKTFQAIRIYVNQEIDCLKKVLTQLRSILLPNARIIIVSFHSLEDGIVKDFLRSNSIIKIARSKYSVDENNNNENENRWLRQITKKPLTPSFDEIKANQRSRSAKMRVAEVLDNNGAFIC